MSRKVWLLIWLIGAASFISPWLSATGEAIPVQERLVIGDQEVRAALTKLGYLPPLSGQDATTIERAIVAFQTAENLNPDGIAGVKTQSVLLKRLLEAAAPEVKARREQLGRRYVCFIESYPDISEQDPYRRNYYRILIGADMYTHVSVWSRFVIRKDLGEILWFNPANPWDQYRSLERWRAGK
jgi:hypothetical protein